MRDRSLTQNTNRSQEKQHAERKGKKMRRIEKAEEDKK